MSDEQRFTWFTVSKVWDGQARTDCYVVQSNTGDYDVSISCMQR